MTELQFPMSAVAFYRACEPSACAEIEGVRLWPAAEAARENVDFVPGMFVHSRGFAVFATTSFGDAYCFDLARLDGADAPVVLLAHDIDFEDLSAEGLRDVAKPIAPDLEDFLEQYVAGEVDQDPLYPPLNP